MSGRLKLLKEKVQVLRNKMVYTRKCETLPTDGKEYFLKWRDWQRWAAHRNRVRIHDTVYLGTSLDDEAVYMRFPQWAGEYSNNGAFSCKSGCRHRHFEL